jgi:hypothetical protein
MKTKTSEYEHILKTIKVAEKEIAGIEAKGMTKKEDKLNAKEKQLIKLYRSNPGLFEGYLKAI